MASVSPNQISSSSSSSLRPWLDLPDYLTEKILERLPISDYVRFGAVCRRWRGIQENHRRRHAPSPPPMLNLPWFIPCYEEEHTVSCFSPFGDEPRSHRLHLPHALQEVNNPSPPPSYLSASFPCGWLLLDDSPSSSTHLVLTLFNPISRIQFRLPLEQGPAFRYRAAMSPPPDWSIFIVANLTRGSTNLLFLRRGDPLWTRLRFQEPEHYTAAQVSAHITAVQGITHIISCGGKFYCLGPEDSPFSFLLPPLNPQFLRLYVLDPRALEPSICFVDMDRSRLPAMWDKMELFLVECDGEVLLVVGILEDGPVRGILEIRVFRADVANKVWVRMRSLGDRVLILHSKCSASFVAADLGVRGNRIYCSESTPWQVFDLGAGSLTDESPAFPSSFANLMFVPSIFVSW